MDKVELNVSDNIADWPPFGLLITLYFAYFRGHKNLINGAITTDYAKELAKIESSFRINGQTQSLMDRAHPLDNILTMWGSGLKLRFKRFLRRAVVKILDVSFFIAFGIFGCRILFTTCNFFSNFLPSMYLAGIILLSFKK